MLKHSIPTRTDQDINSKSACFFLFLLYFFDLSRWWVFKCICCFMPPAMSHVIILCHVWTLTLTGSVWRSGRSLMTLPCTASRQTGITWSPAAPRTTVLYDSGTNGSPSASRCGLCILGSKSTCYNLIQREIREMLIWFFSFICAVLPAMFKPSDQPSVLSEV